MSLLSIQNINTGYGKKQVLFNVSLEVNDGKTILLVGSNGSGKSTLFKVIYGTIPIWKGEQKGTIIFDGIDITNEKSHSLIQKGIMYVPQKNELFEDMTVEQNLEIALLYLNNKQEAKKRLAEVYRQLEILNENKNQVVSKLSGGERKLLSLGMVLMNRPKLLLYDEPLAGLSKKNITLVLSWLQKIKNNGTTIIIIEHRIKELLDFADAVVGMKLGRRNIEALNSLENIKSYMI